MDHRYVAQMALPLITQPSTLNDLEALHPGLSQLRWVCRTFAPWMDDNDRAQLPRRLGLRGCSASNSVGSVGSERKGEEGIGEGRRGTGARIFTPPVRLAHRGSMQSHVATSGLRTAWLFETSRASHYLYTSTSEKNSIRPIHTFNSAVSSLRIGSGRTWRRASGGCHRRGGCRRPRSPPLR